MADTAVHPSSFQHLLLENALAFAPIVLTTLAAYIITSNANLRRTFTLRNLPAVPIKPELKAVATKIYAHGWRVAGLAIFSFLFYQPPQPGREFTRLGVLSTLCMSILSSYGIINMTELAMNYPLKSLHRHHTGAHATLPVKRDNPRENGMKVRIFCSEWYLSRTVVTAINCIILFCAFYSNNDIIACVIITGIIIGLSSLWRYCSVIFFAISSLLYACVGTTIFVATVYGESLRPHSILTGISIYEDPAKFASSEILTLSRWFFPILWGGVGVAFASLCLRFDFDSYLACTGVDVASLARSPLETVPAPSEKPELGEGVVMVSHIPGPFTKPYFSTSIAALMLVHAALIFGLTIAGMGPQSVVIDMYFLPVVCLALPVQFVFVFALALLRGDVRKLLWYNHVPIRKTTPPDMEDGLADVELGTAASVALSKEEQEYND